MGRDTRKIRGKKKRKLVYTPKDLDNNHIAIEVKREYDGLIICPSCKANLSIECEITLHLQKEE